MYNMYIYIYISDTRIFFEHHVFFNHSLTIIRIVSRPLPQELANIAWSWDVLGDEERLRPFLEAALVAC